MLGSIVQIVYSRKLLKVLLFIVAVLVLVFSYPRIIQRQITSAHPGNTASDGCHYCRTNCTYWGEVYGERHCHGGGDSYDYNAGPTDYEQGTTNGADFAHTDNRSIIESSAFVEGQMEGNIDGSTGYTSNPTNNDALEHCSQEITFSSNPSPSYKFAFQSSYKTACIEVYDASYESAYRAANEQALIGYREKIKNEEIVAKANEEKAAEKQRQLWLVSAGLIAGFCFIFSAAWIYSTKQKK